MNLSTFPGINKYIHELNKPRIGIMYNKNTEKIEKMIVIGNNYYSLDYFKSILGECR